MKCQHGVDVFGRCAPCEEGAYLILISELKAELAAAWAEIERMTGELASANRECEVRNELELGYLARAQSAEAELEALRAELQKVRSAAISGMDAATQHGHSLVQQAARLKAESNPDALESERAANALLTEQLQKAEADLAALRADAERLEWYFGPASKADWLDTFMTGVRENWTVDQWRAAIDAARGGEG